MPACLYGAEPTPSAAGLQAWLDKTKLPLDVAALLTNFAPLAWAGLAVSLVDINAVCAENLDPPEPFTVPDMLQLAVTVPTSGLLPQTAAVQKAYRWMRYGQFLSNCQCKLPPAPSAGECPYVNAAVALAPGQTSTPIPYSISTSTYTAWANALGPGATDWVYWRNVSFASETVPGSQRLIEWSSDQAVWHPFFQFDATPPEAPGCLRVPTILAPPRITQTGWVRIHNNSAASQNWIGLNFCFCSPTVTAPPLPPQPTLPTIPLPPTVTCTTDDLCLLVNELARRLTNVSAQLSDVQATVGGRDQLQLIATHPITGEGELQVALGTRAISVEMLTLSEGAFTSALGRPRGLMRVGSVRFGDGIGYSPRAFIDGDRYDTTLPPNAISVSWQLLPNATANLKFLG